MPYLDNAATTLPKPPVVSQAVAEALCAHGNAARGAHRQALAALRAVSAARTAAAEIFGVGDPGRVVFTSGATMALNIALSGVKGLVIATAADHNSVLRPLYRRGGHEIVPVDRMGRLDMARFRAAVEGGGRAVAMTHASNVCGNVYDVEEVGDLCRRRRIPFILDAAQTAGLLDVDMERIGASALCCSGHKSLYGPQGIGCLCLAPDFSPPPLLVGGSGRDSFSPAQPEELPESLEAGTVNSHGAAGLRAGIGYVNSLGGKAFSLADGLARRFVEKARAINGVVLYGDCDAAVRLPIAALNLPGMDAATAADILDERYGISVRSGAHCSPLMHEALGTGHGGALRFSFAHTNTADDVDLAAHALRELAGARSMAK